MYEKSHNEIWFLSYANDAQTTEQLLMVEALHANKSLIPRLCRRLGRNCTISNRNRSNRPKVAALRQDRYIRLQHLHNRLKLALKTNTNETQASVIQE